METQIKKTLLALGLMLFALGSQAQFSLRGGFGGGVVTGPVKIQNIGSRFTENINGNNLSGFEAGFFLKAQIGRLYVKPMAMYGFRYGNVTYVNNADATQQTANFALHKLEVPIMVGWRILGPFFVEAGPSYNYIFSVTEKYNNYSLQVNNTALGYRVGVGAELGPIILSVNYGGATYNSGNRATLVEPYKLIFGLGIILGGDGEEKDSNKKFGAQENR